MNILILCYDNTANNPYTMKEAINRYTKHNAIMIYGCKTYLDYPSGDYRVHFMEKEEFMKYMEWADIIHLNDPLITFRYPTVGEFSDGGSINLLDNIKEDQKVLRHANGTYMRKNYTTINSICRKHNIYQTVSTPDLLNITDCGVWIPQLIDLDNFLFNPPQYDKKVIISHSPTKPIIKSTQLFLDVVNELKKDYDIDVNLIRGISHEECLKIRSKSHLHYDQFLLGAYGVSAVEALVIGQISIVGISKVKKYIPDNPFIDIPSKEHMKDSITKGISLLGDRSLLERGKEWAKKHHNSKDVIGRIIDYYENIGFYRR